VSRDNGQRNIRLLIEYEGTRYDGWQVQKDRRTVAGEITGVLGTVINEVPRLIGAGRTDHGVHAEGQVANFLTRSRTSCADLVEALNRSLPSDINILQASEVPFSFHARHDARSRRYRYQIATRRTAFFKKLIWWVRRPLDTAAMDAAARALPGRHNFTSFADRTATITEPRVRVIEAAFRHGDFLHSFTIEADHFLPRMVRRIVGVLVQVGLGQMQAEEVRRFLAETVDDPAPHTAPPSGLFLERVVYDTPPAAPPRRGPRTPAGHSSR